MQSMIDAIRMQTDNCQMEKITAEQRPQPKSVTDLFVSFTLLALQGFGGVLAIVQQELVEKKRWMTREEFIEQQLDPILEKISRKGMKSLNRAERRILAQAREKVS